MAGPKQVQNLRLSAKNIDSSIAALFVHSVDETGAFVSPGAGSTQVSIKEILSSSGGTLIDSTNVSLGVTIRAGSASGIEYTDGDIDATVVGKALLFDNSSGGTMRPVTIARGLPVNLVAGQSTTVNVSSLAGQVNVADISTATAPASGSTGLVVRFPAPLTDSTNNAIRVFQVASSGGASSTEVTVRQSTVGDLRAAAYQSTRGDLLVQAADVSTATAPVSGSTGLVVRFPAPLTDSTNNAIRVFQVASSGGASSTEVTVRQSTRADLQVTAGDYSTAAPAAGSSGLIVRIAGESTTVNVSSLAGRVLVDQNSTVWPVQVSSVAGQVSVGEYSTAAPATGSTGLVVRQVGYSTTVNVSSLAGRALVDQNSTVWFAQAICRDSSGVGLEASTSRPSSGAQGLHVRYVLNNLQSTAFSTIGNNSTSSTIVSSVAGQRVKCYAYSITSTVQAVNTLTFASSLANMLWTVQMQAFSSGISGANLAVSPPAWLFATEAASPLVFKVTGTTGTYHLSVSYFVEA